MGQLREALGQSDGRIKLIGSCTVSERLPYV